MHNRSIFKLIFLCSVTSPVIHILNNQIELEDYFKSCDPLIKLKSKYNALTPAKHAFT